VGSFGFVSRSRCGRGTRLYLPARLQPLGTQSGLRIYDISDPLHGQLLGAFDTVHAGAYRVAVKDTVALMIYAFDYGGVFRLQGGVSCRPANPRRSVATATMHRAWRWMVSWPT